MTLGMLGLIMIFTTGASGGGDDFNNALRLKRVDYPNARQIHYTYAPGSINDDLSRIAAVNYEDTVTANDPGDAIATYSYNGVGRVVRKDLADPDIRLDYHGDSAGEYAGFDRFGRVIGQQWEDYSGASDADVWHAKHGYDRASNRRYAERQKYGAYSQLYSHDNLHRLKSMLSGTLNSTLDGVIGIRELKSTQTLDALGSATSVNSQGNTGTNTPNDANEYTARVTPGSTGNDNTGNSTDASYGFEDSGDGDDWEALGATTFTVDNSDDDKLKITGLDSGHGNQGIVLLGKDRGPTSLNMHSPVFPGSTGEAGYVFGYKSSADYWLLGYDKAAGQRKVYHVVSGVKTQVASKTAGNLVVMEVRSALLEAGLTYAFGGAGFPSGRYGLYSDTTGVTFNRYDATNGIGTPMTDRWTVFARGMYIDKNKDALRMTSYGTATLAPALVRGVRIGGGEGFEATLSVEQSGSQNPFVGFVFNATSENDFDAVIVKASGTPGGEEIVDGGDKAALTPASSSSAPAPGAGELNWWRITYDGTKVTVKCQSSNGAPSEASWSSATVYWTEDDTGDPFDHVGGRVGFYARSATGWVDGFTLKADRNGDGDFADAGETVFYDDFDVDAGGDRDAEPEHDEAGNLIYDGVHEYVYDAWNRLVVVKNTHVDSGGTKQVGLATATYEYDGLHRRIVRAITNSADLDCTYHDYYDGQSVVEVRNGSDAVLKQHVWGVSYIDELVQVSVNDDPADGTEDDCETNYFTLHNANYNVQMLVDDTGVVVERYEYSPYGQRTVYISPGTNDPDCHAPTLLPTRVAGQPYAINDIGHQGLCHDDVSGLIYNRARMLHPRYGRFMSRDPLGYVDGMSAYEYLKSRPITMQDPRGTAARVTIGGSYSVTNGIGNAIKLSKQCGKCGLLEVEIQLDASMIKNITNPRGKELYADTPETLMGAHVKASYYPNADPSECCCTQYGWRQSIYRNWLRVWASDNDPNGFYPNAGPMTYASPAVLGDYPGIKKGLWPYQAYHFRFMSSLECTSPAPGKSLPDDGILASMLWEAIVVRDGDQVTVAVNLAAACGTIPYDELPWTSEVAETSWLFSFY